LSRVQRHVVRHYSAGLARGNNGMRLIGRSFSSNVVIESEEEKKPMKIPVWKRKIVPERKIFAEDATEQFDNFSQRIIDTSGDSAAINKMLSEHSSLKLKDLFDYLIPPFGTTSLNIEQEKTLNILIDNLLKEQSPLLSRLLYAVWKNEHAMRIVGSERLMQAMECILSLETRFGDKIGSSTGLNEVSESIGKEEGNESRNLLNEQLFFRHRGFHRLFPDHLKTFYKSRFSRHSFFRMILIKYDILKTEHDVAHIEDWKKREELTEYPNSLFLAYFIAVSKWIRTFDVKYPELGNDQFNLFAKGYQEWTSIMNPSLYGEKYFEFFVPFNFLMVNDVLMSGSLNHSKRRYEAYAIYLLTIQALVRDFKHIPVAQHEYISYFIRYVRTFGLNLSWQSRIPSKLFGDTLKIVLENGFQDRSQSMWPLPKFFSDYGQENRWKKPTDEDDLDKNLGEEDVLEYQLLKAISSMERTGTSSSSEEKTEIDATAESDSSESVAEESENVLNRKRFDLESFYTQYLKNEILVDNDEELSVDSKEFLPKTREEKMKFIFSINLKDLKHYKPFYNYMLTENRLLNMFLSYYTRNTGAGVMARYKLINWILQPNFELKLEVPSSIKLETFLEETGMKVLTDKSDKNDPKRYFYINKDNKYNFLQEIIFYFWSKNAYFSSFTFALIFHHLAANGQFRFLQDNILSMCHKEISLCYDFLEGRDENLALLAEYEIQWQEEYSSKQQEIETAKWKPIKRRALEEIHRIGDVLDFGLSQNVIESYVKGLKTYFEEIENKRKDYYHVVRKTFSPKGENHSIGRALSQEELVLSQKFEDSLQIDYPLIEKQLTFFLTRFELLIDSPTMFQPNLMMLQELITLDDELLRSGHLATKCLRIAFQWSRSEIGKRKKDITSDSDEGHKKRKNKSQEESEMTAEERERQKEITNLLQKNAPPGFFRVSNKTRKISTGFSSLTENNFQKDLESLEESDIHIRRLLQTVSQACSVRMVPC
jgi:hypothetical protein